MPAIRWLDLLSLISWPLFLSSVVALLLTDLLGMHLVPGLSDSLHFFDLRIYREAAGAVLAGHPLYAARFQLGFGFTYPPFAALGMLVLQGLPWQVDEAVASAVNLVLVVVLVRLALVLSGRRSASSDLHQRRLSWLIAAVLLWSEPVRTALDYGQIDLLVAVLVLADIARGDRSGRWSGVGIGLAAALKLTPLIFIPYLIFTGRVRMALRALAIFAAAIVASFIALPGDAAAYWFGAVFNLSRVIGHHAEPIHGPANQSLHGMLVRLDASASALPALWLGTCLVVGPVGLWLAIRAARRGDQLLGFVLTAVTGLLVCPVSWTHHWVIATPALLLALRTGPGIRARVATTAGGVLALGSSAVWLFDRTPPGHTGVTQFILTNLYVLAGLALISVVAVGELRTALGPGSYQPLTWTTASRSWRGPGLKSVPRV